MDKHNKKHSLKDPSKLNIERAADTTSIVFKHVLFAVIRTVGDISKGVLGGGTLPEWDKAIEITKPVPMQANRLICKSIFAAIRHQLKDQIEKNYSVKPSKDRDLQIEVFSAFAEGTYTFETKHINQPHELSFLADFTPYYQDWIKAAFTVSEQAAKKLAARFEDYFAYYFYEYRSEYKELCEWADSKDNREQALLLKRMKYKQDLVAKYDQSALQEKEVRLSDVYIEPTFKVFADLLTEKDQNEIRKNRDLESKEHFLSLGDNSIHDFFLKYFINNQLPPTLDQDLDPSRMLILLGQPGHGKSSFCYRCMCDLQQGSFSGEFFFIPLRLADTDILDRPLEGIANTFTDENESVEFKDWIKGSRKKVLFLDGLDEFFMTHSLSNTQIIQFINNCKRLLDKRSSLYIVLTSRFNYVESHQLYDEDCYLFSLGSLNLKQQQTLVNNYQSRVPNKRLKVSGDLLAKINEETKYRHVKELIELPILLQMILIANIEVGDVSSRGVIYKELFDTVINRKWTNDKRLKKYKKNKNFKAQHLREYLAFLALKIFQSRQGFLHKSDIEAFSETKRFKNKRLKIQTPQDSIEDVLKDILTSFYLKETPKDKEYSEADKANRYSIEFLHKSLYEYLSCEYLWLATKNIFIGKDEDGDYKEYEIVSILKKIQALYANTRLTNETVGYLKEIIANDIDCHEDLSKRMSEYLPPLLQHGFIHSYEAPQNGYPHYDITRQALHSFHVYVMIWGELKKWKMKYQLYFNSTWDFFKHHVLEVYVFIEKASFSLEKKKLNEIIRILEREYNNEKKIYFYQQRLLTFQTLNTNKILENANVFDRKKIRKAAWLQYMQNIIIEKQNAVMEEKYRKLFAHYLRLIAAEKLRTSYHLIALNLVSVNLETSQLNDIDFSGVNFRSGNFRSVNFQNANLTNTDFCNANLQNGDFRSADLSNADLSNADLSNTNFYNANLYNVDLFNANLQNGDFRKVNFRNADLRGANLSNTNLQNADFQNTDLSNADLSNANLCHTNFYKATLLKVDFFKADLSNTNLCDTYFYKTDLYKADLRNANLRNATFFKVDIRNVDFRNATLDYLRVIGKDWLINLEEKGVKGYNEIQIKYAISKKQWMFIDRFGIEYKAYVLLPKNKTDNGDLLSQS